MNRLPRHMFALLLVTAAPPLDRPARAAPAHRTSHTAIPDGPVVLTQQPGTALDQTARKLNAADLAAAARRGDTPVVLVGAAPLSTRAGETALFVQLQSAALCGSAGCATSVYLQKGHDDWTKVLDSVSGPVSLSHRTHGGMHDLVINGTDRWVWNGHAYRDTMPAPPMDDLRRSIERYQAQHPKPH
ncbi:hypothetical protein JUN65_15850 [Gluconacetobacter azotocaptans]|uniref:hypothetical protein n=1 Tax=Gluconacetobacter azotocaptans TaxID=142834 RepID=UPI001959CB83|nr:hypothetical protein [Gluconacetobacter azotocaptans]MBM9403051.1 hypothetical protein [Gluconacetobacter azotocaptans]